MKLNRFRNRLFAFGLTLLCILALPAAYAGGAAKTNGAKPAPTAPAGAKHTATATQRNTATGGQASGSGSGLTGSELTGSELTGSELTGSELTGFGIGFGRPPLLAPPFPFLAPDASGIERASRLSSPPDLGPTPNPPREPSAPVDDTASTLAAYSAADTKLQSAQTHYDAVLTRIRVRLDENATYQQARARQTQHKPVPVTSSSLDTGSIDAATTVAEMESTAVAADPQANAARQKLDEAVLARNAAERAKAAPARNCERGA